MNPAALAAALRGDLVNALVASTPGSIERQEAEGQQALVASSMLPKTRRGVTIAQLTELGFEFGDDIDELFVQAQLPVGWTKKAGEHSMHSELLDEQGRSRASIFYKAAFYDRRADLRMLRRFDVDNYQKGTQPDTYQCVITDGGKMIRVIGERNRNDFSLSDAQQDEGEKWLNDNYPDWQNPLSYW